MYSLFREALLKYSKEKHVRLEQLRVSSLESHLRTYIGTTTLGRALHIHTWNTVRKIGLFVWRRKKNGLKPASTINVPLIDPPDITRRKRFVRLVRCQDDPRRKLQKYETVFVHSYGSNAVAAIRTITCWKQKTNCTLVRTNIHKYLPFHFSAFSRSSTVCFRRYSSLSRLFSNKTPKYIRVIGVITRLTF